MSGKGKSKKAGAQAASGKEEDELTLTFTEEDQRSLSEMGLDPQKIHAEAVAEEELKEAAALANPMRETQLRVV